MFKQRHGILCLFKQMIISIYVFTGEMEGPSIVVSKEDRRAPRWKQHNRDIVLPAMAYRLAHSVLGMQESAPSLVQYCLFRTRY